MDSWFGKPDEPFFTRRRPTGPNQYTYLSTLDLDPEVLRAVADLSSNLQVKLTVLTYNSLFFDPWLGRRAPADASDNPCHSCHRYCRLPTDCRRRRSRPCCSVSLISLRNQQKSPLPRLRPTRRSHWLTGMGRRHCDIDGDGWMDVRVESGCMVMVRAKFRSPGRLASFLVDFPRGASIEYIRPSFSIRSSPGKFANFCAMFISLSRTTCSFRSATRASGASAECRREFDDVAAYLTTAGAINGDFNNWL